MGAEFQAAAQACHAGALAVPVAGFVRHYSVQDHGVGAEGDGWAVGGPGGGGGGGCGVSRCPRSAVALVAGDCMGVGGGGGGTARLGSEVVVDFDKGEAFVLA